MLNSGTVRKIMAFFIVIATLLAVIPVAAATPVMAQPASIVYNLFATDGWWTMADGTQIYSYGFIGGRAGQPFSYETRTGALVNVPGGAPAPQPGINTAAEQAFQGNAQFPAPLIYCAVGDVVQINLKNLGVSNTRAPNDPHTIHLHALDVDAANDGVPETSVACIPANFGNAPSGMPGAGNVVVYMFTALHPGTYMYHCHQEADIHVTMGMYGALVVYDPSDPAAATGPGSGVGGTLMGQTYDKDYVIMLSDTDVRQHRAEQGLGRYNPVDFTPQYWFINGLSFPNTIYAGFPAGHSYTNWIAAHPGYDPFPMGSVSAGQKVLLRMINLGFQTQPMHMHGFHFTVIGTDQRQLAHSYEKNTLTIGSGETYEVIVDFSQQGVTSTYDPGVQSRYDVATGAPKYNTDTGFPPIPDPLGGTFIGGPVVSGLTIAADSSQYFPFHNHDDYKATNNGVYPGGQFTMIKPLP